ncbi:actin-related protein 7 [Tanacetum coccineum]
MPSPSPSSPSPSSHLHLHNHVLCLRSVIIYQKLLFRMMLVVSKELIESQHRHRGKPMAVSFLAYHNGPDYHISKPRLMLAELEKNDACAMMDPPNTIRHSSILVKIFLSYEQRIVDRLAESFKRDVFEVLLTSRDTHYGKWCCSLPFVTTTSDGPCKEVLLFKLSWLLVLQVNNEIGHTRKKGHELIKELQLYEGLLKSNPLMKLDMSEVEKLKEQYTCCAEDDIAYGKTLESCPKEKHTLPDGQVNNTLL